VVLFSVSCGAHPRLCSPVRVPTSTAWKPQQPLVLRRDVRPVSECQHSGAGGFFLRCLLVSWILRRLRTDCLVCIDLAKKTAAPSTLQVHVIGSLQHPREGYIIFKEKINLSLAATHLCTIFFISWDFYFGL
jgi:hypothetical protein